MAVNYTANLALAKPDAGTKPWWAYDHERQDILDDAVAGYLSKSVAGSSDVTLTTAEAWHHGIIFTGALTGNINVVVPTKQRHYLLRNDTTGDFTLTVKTTAGTGVALKKGEFAVLSCDGTNVVRWASSQLLASGGAANAYTLTPAPALTAYDTDQVFGFRANFANTGTATLNVSGLGAKTIKKIVGATKVNLAANDIIIGQPVFVFYDGTDMVAINSIGAVAYLPVLRESFIADKNAAAQGSIASGTGTKVTFTNEVRDQGGLYDAANSRWTPSAGLVFITAKLIFTAGVVDQAIIQCQIRKNGTNVAIESRNASGTGAQAVTTWVLDVANGTDYYEVYAHAEGAGDKTIGGQVTQTQFNGVHLGS